MNSTDPRPLEFRQKAFFPASQLIVLGISTTILAIFAVFGLWRLWPLFFASNTPLSLPTILIGVIAATLWMAWQTVGVFVFRNLGKVYIAEERGITVCRLKVNGRTASLSGMYYSESLGATRHYQLEFKWRLARIAIPADCFEDWERLVDRIQQPA